MMRTALFAIGASLPLVLGALLGTFWRPPRQLLAATLAFAAGALTSAVAFELFQDSYSNGGAWRAGLGFAAGAVTFVVVDTLTDRWSGGGSAVGLALLASVTLDGIPENAALGVSLTQGGSVALLAAIFASNFPEALGGAARMRDDDRSTGYILGLWTATAVLLALAVFAGYALFAGASEEQLAVPLAFAGGAVLASIIDTIAPEAYEEGGPYIALSSAAGFFITFMLSH